MDNMGINGDIEEKSDDEKDSMDEDTSNANNNVESAVTVGESPIAVEANKSSSKNASVGLMLEATRKSTGSNAASLNNTGNKNDHH